MYEQLDILNMALGLARHSAARQAQIAGNIANADTPGFRATDIAEFSKSYDAPSSTPNPLTIRVVDRAGPSDPNGNTVSVETEMLHSIDAKRAHDRALTIYQTSLSILRTSIGTGR